MAQPITSAALKSSDAEARQVGLRLLAIMPAHNEAASVRSVIKELLAAQPDAEVVVIDDGSSDETAVIAAAAGATVIRLPFNVGIGGAVQTGHQYARDHGFDVVVQVDADGQHDPREIAKLLEPIREGQADLVVGTRFAGESGYRAPFARRVGIVILSRIVSMIVGRRVTDPTSGFRAANRRALTLFADDYPHDYPEVEATVLVHRRRLRMIEVPTHMRERVSGRSSITFLYSIVYMGKVLLALFVGLFRSYPQED